MIYRLSQHYHPFCIQGDWPEGFLQQWSGVCLYAIPHLLHYFYYSKHLFTVLYYDIQDKLKPFYNIVTHCVDDIYQPLTEYNKVVVFGFQLCML